MKCLYPTILLLGLLPASSFAAPRQNDTKPATGATPARPPADAPAGSAATAAVPPAAAEVSPRYIIGADDSINVLVWKEPGFSGSFPVRPDGMISIPLVGDLAAAGLTPMQLGTDITARLGKYITDPNVTVTVLAVNSKRIFLLGEVQHIGAMPLTPDMTPLQAISAAGGLTPYANARHIYILRGEQGKQQKIRFDYKKAIKDGNQQGVSLRPGDTIVVP